MQYYQMSNNQWIVINNLEHTLGKGNERNTTWYYLKCFKPKTPSSLLGLVTDYKYQIVKRGLETGKNRMNFLYPHKKQNTPQRMQSDY